MQGMQQCVWRMTCRLQAFGDGLILRVLRESPEHQQCSATPDRPCLATFTSSCICPLQVIGLCEKKRDPPLSHIILDTPGQIEIFTWSASGQIVTELFASSFPTLVWWVHCIVRTSLSEKLCVLQVSGAWVLWGGMGVGQG